MTKQQLDAAEGKCEPADPAAARLPWHPFYPEAWLANSAVAAMPLEAVGAYMNLLAAAWGDGSSLPSLPNNDAKLARISRLDPKGWKKHGETIRALLQSRSDGNLIPEGFEEMWREQQRKHAKRVAAGLESGKVRAEQRQRRKVVRAALNHRSNNVRRADEQKDVDVRVEPAPNGAGVLPFPGRPPARDGARAAPGDDQLRAEDDAYAAKLAASLRSYERDHPDDYRELRQVAMANVPLPEAHPLRDQVVEGAIVSEFCRRGLFPTRAEWRSHGNDKA